MSGSDTLGLLTALYDQWKNEEFTDLQVIVEGRKFKCHSLVLCACSDFFKAMMRSNMKESQEGVVHLQGMAAETFSMLLESMYKDFIDLTNENVLDIWHASCQLQINSVMERCETFICDQYMTAENCVLLYFHAKKLSVEKIVEKTLDCICNNFEQVAKIDSFLDASHDDIFQIINREDLKIKSEDSVIEFILKWVCHFEQNTSTSASDENRSKYTQNQGTEARRQAEKVRDGELADQHETKNMEQTMVGNKIEASAMSTNVTADIHDSSITGCTHEETVAEDMTRGDQRVVEKEETVETETMSDVKLRKYPRSKYLQKFLGLSRIYLASKYFLEKLMKHELVKRQREVCNRVFDALLYKLDVGRRHGSWPQTAIHRSTSSMKHAMVFIGTRNCFCSAPVTAYILDERSVRYYTSTPIDKGVCQNITMFDNNNLVVGINAFKKGHKIKLYNVIGGWQDVGPGVKESGSNSRICLLAHDHYIYRGKDNGGRHALERLDMTSAIDGWWIDPPFLRCQYNAIQSVVPFEQYIIAFSCSNIIVMDTVSECIIQVPSIGGPMENIISFNDHENTCTYILQMDGMLWKILHSDTLHRLKFEHVAKLWNISWKIHGGIFYKGTLFIFGMEESGRRDVNVRQTCVPGVFENIEYVFISSLTRCVPMIISNYTPVF